MLLIFRIDNIWSYKLWFFSFCIRHFFMFSQHCSHAYIIRCITDNNHDILNVRLKSLICCCILELFLMIRINNKRYNFRFDNHNSRLTCEIPAPNANSHPFELKVQVNVEHMRQTYTLNMCLIIRRYNSVSHIHVSVLSLMILSLHWNN